LPDKRPEGYLGLFYAIFCRSKSTPFLTGLLSAVLLKLYLDVSKNTSMNNQYKRLGEILKAQGLINVAQFKAAA